MRFVETPIFTKAILGESGLRKLRWAATGRGKRSGLRVIYYWHAAEQAVYMLYAYPKNVQENLTPGQLRMLSRLVKEEFR